MRRWTAIAATVLLVLEAGVSALAGMVLGAAARGQHMMLGGISYKAMATGAYVGLGVQAAFLLLTAGLLVRLAIGDQNRPFGRPTRFVLIAAAVFHGVLAALMLALSGVGTFLVVALTLTLLVLVLFTQAPRPAPLPRTPPAPPAPAS